MTEWLTSPLQSKKRRVDNDGGDDHPEEAAVQCVIHSPSLGSNLLLAVTTATAAAATPD